MASPPPRLPRAPAPELAAYYGLVGCYFFAFGLQLVLYPSIVTFSLEAAPREVGFAIAALQAPMFALLLFGGLLAERAQPGPTLAALQLAFAVPPLGLAAAALLGALSLPLALGYALAMGSVAAFMLPVRDSALNAAVGRALARGRTVALATAATSATAVQIGAQLAGIGLASTLGPLGVALAAAAPGHDPRALGAAALLLAQAAATILGAGLALRLRVPAPARSEKSKGAFRDVFDGLRYAVRDPVMGPMLGSAAYVGVFVIGSFQVLFPLILREAYGGGQAELGALNACFWSASLAATLLLARFGPLRRPGRALLSCHVVGGLVLASFAVDKPLWAFFALAALWGFSAGVAIATSRTITQSAADPRYLGRVLAVYSMGFMGGGPIGSVLVGHGAELFGPRIAALLPAAGLILGSVAMAAFSPLWRLEHDPAASLRTTRSEAA